MVSFQYDQSSILLGIGIDWKWRNACGIVNIGGGKLEKREKGKGGGGRGGREILLECKRIEAMSINK